MANFTDSLEALMSVDGAKAVALVDSTSGMVLAKSGGGLDLDIAAAGNTEVVRAKLRVIEELELNEEIDDILITLSKQYHIIRPLKDTPEVFIYLVLDSSKANLALARIAVKKADAAIQL